MPFCISIFFSSIWLFAEFNSFSFSSKSFSFSDILASYSLFEAAIDFFASSSFAWPSSNSRLELISLLSPSRISLSNLDLFFSYSLKPSSSLIFASWRSFSVLLILSSASFISSSASEILSFASVLILSKTSFGLRYISSSIFSFLFFIKLIYWSLVLSISIASL